MDVDIADTSLPPVTVRTWHDRYPHDKDDRFDDNGNEYVFVQCFRNADTLDEEKVFDATGWMKREVADEIARRWNSHDELLAAVRGLANCADGFSFAEAGVREAVGNTNWAVLRHWIDEARAAIAKAEGRS